MQPTYTLCSERGRIGAELQAGAFLRSGNSGLFCNAFIRSLNCSSSLNICAPLYHLLLVAVMEHSMARG